MTRMGSLFSYIILNYTYFNRNIFKQFFCCLISHIICSSRYASRFYTKTNFNCSLCIHDLLHCLVVLRNNKVSLNLYMHISCCHYSQSIKASLRVKLFWGQTYQVHVVLKYLQIFNSFLHLLKFSVIFSYHSFQ
jgi:hypothetical protein